jgi:hypothetical protein
MNLKKIAFLTLVLAVAAGNIFAHDKGDLMLNIEPSIGIRFPIIELREFGGTKANNPIAIGGDLGLRGTVHYYFLGFFGVNTGIGIEGFIGSLTVGRPLGEFHQDFAALYFQIPFGVRFSLNAFAFGAGITGNFPMLSQSRWWYDTAKSRPDAPVSFDAYLGYYFDIGFDTSGNKGNEGGFGLLGRLSGSFADVVTSKHVTTIGYYDPFNYVSLSLIFQFAIQIASLPMGGN